ncbi:MAG: DUF938 domain-containing protein [Pseudomonadota bacterium]|nr:DUF938 domain-containing protein [Pseudomonadota bacterium]
MDNKPFSQACENNKLPILEVLQRHLTSPASLLEVGSGTGQHAAFFSGQLPHIHWHPSDVTENLPGITAWCEEAGHSNLQAPISFDVTQQNALPSPLDHLFSANTLHIMSWPAVEAFFERVPALVKPAGYVIFYGPFKYNGEFTSDSNARFDLWLKARGAHQGIRDFEAIARLATQAGLRLVEDVRMPANNQTLVWQKAP